MYDNRDSYVSAWMIKVISRKTIYIYINLLYQKTLKKFLYRFRDLDQSSSQISDKNCIFKRLSSCNMAYFKYV